MSMALWDEKTLMAEVDRQLALIHTAAEESQRLLLRVDFDPERFREVRAHLAATTKYLAFARAVQELYRVNLGTAHAQIKLLTQRVEALEARSSEEG